MFYPWIEEKLHAWDTDSLFNYENEGPYAGLAVPLHGSEHFVPLFYAMGAAGRHPHPHVNTLFQGWDFAVLSNSVYQFNSPQ